MIVCEFRDVTIDVAPPYEAPLSDLTFELRQGALALCDLGGRDLPSPLADAAEGLVVPSRGAVAFLGEDWQAVGPARSAELRSRIGRVFDRNGWVSNLDVDENVTLARRHHTGASHGEVLLEADRLAAAFGLSALPRLRPAAVPRHELRRAEWVRAFLGDPDLLILEQPLRGAPPEAFEALLGAVGRAREAGAAVLWIAAAGRELRRLAPQASFGIARRGEALVVDEEVRAWESRSSSDT